MSASASLANDEEGIGIVVQQHLESHKCPIPYPLASVSVQGSCVHYVRHIVHFGMDCATFTKALLLSNQHLLDDIFILGRLIFLDKNAE